MPSPQLSPPPPRETGMALLLALWAMMAMALLVAGIRITGAHDATLAAAMSEQAQLRAAADGMINLAILRLLDARPGNLPPVAGEPFGTRFAGWTGTLSVQDEAGKIDLNEAPEQVLVRMLLAAGLDQDAAQALAEKILDWREPGAGRRLNGAKAEDYRRVGLSYAPRGARMESVDELRLVLDMPAPLFTTLKPMLTVVSQNAWPDQSVAPAPVLRAVASLDDDQIARIEAARAARLVQADDGTISDMAAPPAGGHAFTIAARIVGRLVTVQRQATVRLTGIPRAPIVVYQWL